MSNKTYFYSDGTEKYGPFTVDELKNEHISHDSLIWFEGEISWHPITSFPSLLQELKPYLKNEDKHVIQMPPPLPQKGNSNTSLPAKKFNPIILLFIWTALHLFALLVSYAGIEFFSTSKHPNTDKFWPFVDFSWEARDSWGFNRSYSRGIFYQYDWTEFAVYVGAAWMMYFIIKYSFSSKTNQL